MRLASPILFLATVLSAQQIGENTKPGAATPATFQTSTQLVIETVVVKDKSGKPIEGLTAKDFSITEDGAPQTIRFFEYQKLEQALLASALAPLPEKIVPVPKLTKTQIAPETPGNMRYRDRRLLALYFDMTAMAPPDQLRALNAAKKFIRTSMTGADLMAIMQFDGGAVQVLQDFTADRARLESIVQTLIVGEDENADTNPNDADTGAAFGQDDGEFNIFSTDRQLAALQTAAKTHRTLARC